MYGEIEKNIYSKVQNKILNGLCSDRQIQNIGVKIFSINRKMQVKSSSINKRTNLIG
jgi:hypothetical protein